MSHVGSGADPTEAKIVRLQFERGGGRHDEFGRLLCYVWSAGLQVNSEPIRQGHSTYYTKHGEGERYADRFRGAERRQWRSSVWEWVH